MPLDAFTVALDWLALCVPALSGDDAHAAAQLLLPDGWLRDVLVFTWDVRSLEGHDRIASYLNNTLAKARITDVHLSENPDLVPRIFHWPDLQATGIEVSFTFQCSHGHGRAFARLLPDAEGRFRAYTLLTELADLVGHEEHRTLPFRDDLAVGGKYPPPVWELHNAFARWKQQVETDPHVLIVGAGQNGLQVAARFKQMNIPSLVIDRQDRIGNSWRKRYPSLVLHTTRKHASLLYQPYPRNWPDFAPRDKLADWIEHYASIQDLIVWLKSEFKQPPTYDSTTRKWKVTVVRDGVEVDLNPAHIVLATGTTGNPYIPDVPNMDLFRGQIVHTAHFPGGAAYTGKRVVVIGAGNSSLDACEDLVNHGAASVTMVQRSSSCAIARCYQEQAIHGAFPDDLPQEVVDFKMLGLPNQVLKRLSRAAIPRSLEYHNEMYAKLEKGGIKVNREAEIGLGSYALYLGRASGYWTDKGHGAEMVEDGRIKVRQGVTPERFTEDGVILSDASKLPADVVVFGTGYSFIREASRDILGDDVIDQTEEIFGLDEEGEIKGSYRPCGYPGLWFATGDFAHGRYFSKTLALQIKAIQLGLLQHNGRRDGAVDSTTVNGMYGP